MVIKRERLTGDVDDEVAVSAGDRASYLEPGGNVDRHQLRVDSNDRHLSRVHHVHSPRTACKHTDTRIVSE